MSTRTIRIRAYAVPFVALAMILAVAGAAAAAEAPAGAAGEANAASPETSPPAKTTGKEKAPELLLWDEMPMVVSASRHEEPVSRAPNAVSIITAQDIHESGLTQLGDVMRMAVGVDVGAIDQGIHAVGVRGLHGRWANTTLVLVDGRTIFNPVWGGVMWSRVPVFAEDIDRIEVVRGPGGAAWGANAANGVVNIITKKAADTPGLFLSQTLSNRLDSVTHVRYGLTADKLDLRLSAGYLSAPNTGVREGPEEHDFARASRLNLRSTYHLDKERSLDVDAGYEDGVSGGMAEPALASGATFAGARWFPQAHFLRMRFTQQKSADDLWYVQYFMNQETWGMSEGGLWTRYTQHDVEAQRTQRLSPQHLLTYGGNLRTDFLTNGDPPTGFGMHGLRFDNERSHNHQAGLFIQDRFDLTDQWTLVGGVRVDRNSYTGWEWSGRGTALFHPVADHTFRVSVARAFRAPTLVDRAISIVAVPPGFIVVNGNEDLGAAYVNAYEFGYTFERKALRLNAEFFYNQYTDLMGAQRITAPGVLPRRSVFHNFIDGDLYGFELSGEWQATKALRMDASYVWEQWVPRYETSWYDQPLWITDQAIPPQQKVGLGARWEPVKDLTVSGRMWWVDEVIVNGPVRIPPYARFDFNVAKKFGKDCELAVGVLNAFDPRHPEMATYGTTPIETGERTWYVRFQKSF